MHLEHVPRLKSKQNIRLPAMSTLLKDAVNELSKKVGRPPHKAEVLNKFCKIFLCSLKSSIYFNRASADLEFVAYCWQTNVRIALIL